MAALIAKTAPVATPISRGSTKVQASLRPAVTRPAPKAQVPAVRANQMMVWQPVNNKQFETFSYLPPLTADQIAKQVDYIVGNGWIPCLEFSEESYAYVANTNTVRFGPVSNNYYDNRYWTMWKLPMFGCNDPAQVLMEIQKCSRAFPEAYQRLVAFDNKRQVQVISFLVQRPKNSTDYCPIDQRSVGGY
uniref:Ribulose bisphosphate carboxylase small subunit, chloroplastic n=1 Tax=Dunaliella parva TaxID=3048 RepID=G4WEL1_9CHLO|nr:ribulose-1,5-bisphosphate carboxylase/oxygenase small subunit [Dunaliella parva]